MRQNIIKRYGLIALALIIALQPQANYGGFGWLNNLFALLPTSVTSLPTTIKKNPVPFVLLGAVGTGLLAYYLGYPKNWPWFQQTVKEEAQKLEEEKLLKQEQEEKKRLELKKEKELEKEQKERQELSEQKTKELPGPNSQSKVDDPQNPVVDKNKQVTEQNDIQKPVAVINAIKQQQPVIKNNQLVTLSTQQIEKKEIEKQNFANDDKIIKIQKLSQNKNTSADSLKEAFYDAAHSAIKTLNITKLKFAFGLLPDQYKNKPDLICTEYAVEAGVNPLLLVALHSLAGAPAGSICTKSSAIGVARKCSRDKNSVTKLTEIIKFLVEDLKVSCCYENLKYNAVSSAILSSQEPEIVNYFIKRNTLTTQNFSITLKKALLDGKITCPDCYDSTIKDKSLDLNQFVNKIDYYHCFAHLIDFANTNKQELGAKDNYTIIGYILNKLNSDNQFDDSLIRRVFFELILKRYNYTKQFQLKTDESGIDDLHKILEGFETYINNNDFAVDEEGKPLNPIADLLALKEAIKNAKKLCKDSENSDSENSNDEKEIELKEPKPQKIEKQLKKCEDNNLKSYNSHKEFYDAIVSLCTNVTANAEQISTEINRLTDKQKKTYLSKRLENEEEEEEKVEQSVMLMLFDKINAVNRPIKTPESSKTTYNDEPQSLEKKATVKVITPQIQYKIEQLKVNERTKEALLLIEEIYKTQKASPPLNKLKDTDSHTIHPLEIALKYHDIEMIRALLPNVSFIEKNTFMFPMHSICGELNHTFCYLNNSSATDNSLIDAPIDAIIKNHGLFKSFSLVLEKLLTDKYDLTKLRIYNKRGDKKTHSLIESFLIACPGDNEFNNFKERAILEIILAIYEQTQSFGELCNDTKHGLKALKKYCVDIKKFDKNTQIIKDIDRALSPEEGFYKAIDKGKTIKKLLEKIQVTNFKQTTRRLKEYGFECPIIPWLLYHLPKYSKNTDKLCNLIITRYHQLNKNPTIPVAEKNKKAFFKGVESGFGIVKKYAEENKLKLGELENIIPQKKINKKKKK